LGSIATIARNASLGQLDGMTRSHNEPDVSAMFLNVVLHGSQVVLRAGAIEDVPRLLAILNEAEVATRWGAHWSEDDVVKQFVGADKASVITVDDEIIGAIQFDEEDDPMYRHVASTYSSRPRGTVRVLDQTLSGPWLAI
jgi:hypothetical protein